MIDGVTDLDSLLKDLRRSPDVEAPNLFAHDASDRLILLEAADALRAAPFGSVAVIGDRYGALTLGAILEFAVDDVRVCQDPITGEQALARNAAQLGATGRYRQCGLDATLLGGAKVVLLQLPRALAELTEIAEAIARWADPDVQVISAGRIKHMTRSMNDVLGRSFSEVHATRATGKSRGLIASGVVARTAPPTYPVHSHVADYDLDVYAHGAVFAGESLDIGTRFLAEHIDKMKLGAHTIIDLGCGTGILAVLLARARPDAAVIGSDRSAAAVASTLATARAAGVDVVTERDDALSRRADNSADLIVCNPPFHENAAVHTGGAEKLFAAAARVLKPGGELWTVHNAHLHFRPLLGRVVGPTETVGRNAKFTVTKSIVK